MLKQNPFNHLIDHPLGRLPREDLDLIVELVLQSGSLKGLAKAYGVSYPTIRIRLDRTISHLRAVVAGQEPNPLAELLAGLVERGEMTVSGARAVRGLVKSMAEGGAASAASEPVGQGRRGSGDDANQGEA